MCGGLSVKKMRGEIDLRLLPDVLGFMTDNSFFAFVRISDCQAGGFACISRAHE